MICSYCNSDKIVVVWRSKTGLSQWCTCENGHEFYLDPLRKKTDPNLEHLYVRNKVGQFK